MKVCSKARRPARGVALLTIGLGAASLALAGLAFADSALAGQTLISSHGEMYPRAVLIAHNANSTRNGDIVVSATSFDTIAGSGGSGHEDLFISHDQGVSFAPLGSVTDSAFGAGLCCGGLFELPKAIGALPAGTLLWAGSVGGDTPTAPMQIRIYSSTDEGATWTYLSNCATATVPRSTGGLWEPGFATAGDGRLMCYYTDETRPGHSQILTEVATSDGVTWTPTGDLAISTTAADRPGMVNVIALPSGTYAASYEICGPLNCATYFKTSADGINWGAAGTLGTPVALSNGTTFWHTPTLVWSPVPGQTRGQLLLQGQILTLNGVVQAGNGATLFYNSAGDGTGGWQSFASPTNVSMPSGTAGNACQNYSSPLLPLGNGRTTLSLASDYVGSACETWFNVAPLSGVGLSGGNVSLSGGSQTGGDFTVTALGSLGDTFNLSVSATGAPATFSLSQSQVMLNADGTASVHVGVAPTTLASAQSHKKSPFGGGAALAFAGLGLGLAMRRKPVVGALAATAVVLTGCGGGSSGGGSAATTPQVTSYTATLHAASVSDPTITADQTFTISISS